MAAMMSNASMAPPSTNAFSPLTLFECTITNATMLVDSMPLKELVLAIKFVYQLQGHMLEVLEPTAGHAADIVEEHNTCPPKIHKIGQAGTSKTEAKTEMLDVTVKEEVYDDDDDDIQILEEDNSFGEYADSSYSYEKPSKMPKISNTSSLASNNFCVGNELTPEWKNILRKSYKMLKEETNSNVFDFSLPYSARVNTEAANKVIKHASTLASVQPSNMAQWIKLNHSYFRGYYSMDLQRTWKARMNKEKFNVFFKILLKLNRRQKSFEQLKTNMNPTEKIKFEAVLNRDYTSSDEETGADLDGDSRVKELTWESPELSQMKKKLDEHFYDNLADEKQRQEMGKLKRVGLQSTRPAPIDTHRWAKKS